MLCSYTAFVVNCIVAFARTSANDFAGAQNGANHVLLQSKAVFVDEVENVSASDVLAHATFRVEVPTSTEWRNRLVKTNRRPAVQTKKTSDTMGQTHLQAGGAGHDRLLDDADASDRPWIVQFCVHCLGATTLLLFLCADNLLWLLPYLCWEDKYGKAAWFVCCNVFLWCVAYGVSYATPSEKLEGLELVCNVLTTIMMLCLTMMFFTDWYYDRDDDSDDSDSTESDKHESRDDSGPATTCSVESKVQRKRCDSALEASTRNADFEKQQVCNESGLDTLRSRRSSLPKTQGARFSVGTRRASLIAQLSYWRLFLVTTAVNLDSISASVPLMTFGVFTPLELLIGYFAAAAIVVMLTLGLSQFSLFTDVVMKIPLFVIFGLLTAAFFGVGCALMNSSEDGN